MEGTEGNIEKLLAARESLRATLEESKSFSSKIEETRLGLQKINGNLSLLSSELCSTYSRKSTLYAVGAHVDRAFGPVSAVLRIYDSVHGLEKSIMAGPSGGDVVGYIGLVKQLEEAMRFLSDNCGLAVEWMEDVAKLLDENVGTDDHYIVKVKRLLRILKELKALETRARLNGGLLSDSFDKLELEFRHLVKDNGSFSHQVPELHAIIERLKANDRMENCITIYSDIRSSNARAALQRLNLSYLEIEISESDSVQKFEDHIVQWGNHVEFALKNVLHAEYDLCKSILEKHGADVPLSCFARITAQSGFLAILEFGDKITKAKKDAIKLLKLLDMFQVLDKLRVDFNKLFGSKACLKIQNQTRDLVKRVVNGASEIFMELRLQVELQRHNMIPPPSDASVPRLVTFVTNYCIMLLEDDYKPVLSQVLSIHQIWNRGKSPDGFLRKELQRIVEAMEINLETWSKTFDDPALSCFFLMNNYTFLCHFLQETVFGDLMGDNWLREHQQKMETYAELYLKESWGKLSGILSEEGLILFSPGRSTTQELVKKRLREFNDMFFLHNYGYLVENGSSPGKYVRYTVWSLEGMLKSLFQPNMTRFSRSNSSKSTHLMGKLRNAVSNQFRVAPIPT
ncbi:hypothetical protein Cgig2_031177 [Carnegiea gigantea]|uniref:Exocyst subunit Exo70 family protein n=1 Tax=Carnegiea gigantea TaxID=171969 RepID=A0A9Q1KRF0_9CARY|nr:hypothetical protein Cgig2_031177 [Carnegiea gigantea]